MIGFRYPVENALIKVSLHIYNGQQILSGNYNTVKGVAEFNFDTGELAAGIYLLLLKTDNFYATEKVFINVSSI